MKNRLNMLLLAVLALSAFTACEKDDSSNPTLNEPATFTLNVPPYAANNVYDLKNSTLVELTCSQPDYGFTASTTYAVQVAFDKEFMEADGDKAANYKTLETTYTTARIDVDASELNSALIDLWNTQNEGVEFPASPVSVTVRLKANVTGIDRGTCFSNIIEIPKVLGNTAASLKIPANIYLNGTITGKDVWRRMPAVNGMNGEYFALVYFKAGDTFKFGTKEKEYFGADYVNFEMTDDANAGAEAADDGAGHKDIKVNNAGWYVLYMKTTIQKNEYVFNLGFYPGEVYLIGPVIGQTDWGFASEGKFTAPATGDEEFVSPALLAGGEVRMSVKTKDGVDWWRTEFTLYKGSVYYRENNAINANWKDDKGADYSIQAAAGNTIHLNFTNETGELK